MKFRRLLFHLIAAGVVMLPLLALEILLQIFVAAPPVALADPYVSFGEIRPLFVLDDSGRRYETADERLHFFRRQSFSAVKAKNSFRIFVLGGSTVQGRPWSTETSFGSWLQLALAASAGDTDWQVINCGGISYAGYRLAPVMRELLAYEPDLFIICTGHNEFLEDRTYSRLKRTPKSLIRAHDALLKLRSYSLANRFLESRRNEDASRAKLPAEVRARLDFHDGLASYHRDDAWRAGVLAHFSHNLQTMVLTAQQAKVPVVLMRPAANIKDCSPFKSEFDAHLSPRARQQAQALLDRAIQLSWSQPGQKLQLLAEVTKIDPRHARTCYLTGKCYEQLARSKEAKQWFQRARDEDICPLRIPTTLADAITATAKRHATGYIDMEQLIQQQTDDGIVGDEWLVDHVHPTIAGHQLIANALLDAMARMRLVETSPGWQAQRDESWSKHLAELDKAYFARGAQRLKRLAQWSRGRIPKENGE
jgi:lysophospholipase L1-like esterase